jgi:hypothetical protein
LSKRGSRYEAFLAVPDGESQDTVNNRLTFTLLWLERVRNGSQRGTLSGVRKSKWSGGLDGKLAARHPGGDAPMATTTRH